ncbi:MAG: hypothetical protein ACHQ51_02640 [Elusimicrobiota bacterium]
MAPRSQTAALIAASIGGLLVLGTNLLAGLSLAMVVFTLYGLAPYALLRFASDSPYLSDPWTVGGAGAAAVAAEAGIRAAVFLFPTHSTAGVALLVSPAVILLIFMPLGGAAGLLMSRAGRGAPRAAIGALFAAALGLTVLGLGRPDLFPTVVIRRNAVLKELGEPRVVLGGDAFHKTVVSTKSAWPLAADLDGVPGDEIAVADASGADLFDSSDLTAKGRIDFGPDLKWSWYSNLARVDGHVAVVQTGGGFSQTEVRGTDGALLWNHSDDQLPPNALRALNLPGRGDTVFIAAAQHAVERLDASGKTVWRHESNSPQLIALAPQAGKTPAWIATREYDKPVKVWDQDGNVLGEMTPAKGETPYSVVDWPAGRALALGRESTLRLAGLDGKTAFELPLTPMHLAQAESYLPSPRAKPLLAVLAAAPEGVKRWRLLLLDSAGSPVYDELFGEPLRLLKARRADGAETLLLGGADGVRVLR